MYNTLKCKAKHLRYTTTFDMYKLDNITGRANDQTRIPRALTKR